MRNSLPVERRCARRAVTLCSACIVAVVTACNNGGTVDAGDAGVDAPVGHFVLFHGAYSVPPSSDVSFEQSVLGSLLVIRPAAAAFAWTTIDGQLAGGMPLPMLLASLDTEFAGPNASNEAFSPGRLVRDAVAAGHAATTDAAEQVARDQTLAALDTVLALAIESEENASVTEAPQVQGDAAGTSWGDATAHWDRAAMYFSAIEDDVRAVQSASGNGVWCNGSCTLASANLAARVIDDLVRGQAAYNVSISPSVSPAVVRSLTEIGAQLRWHTTAPFWLASLAHANAIARTRASGGSDFGSDPVTGWIAAETVLQTASARNGVDVSAARAFWQSAPGTVDVPSAVHAVGGVYAAVSASASAEYGAAASACGAIGNLPLWEGIAVQGALIDTMDDALAFTMQDVTGLTNLMITARMNSEAGDCVTGGMQVMTVVGAIARAAMGGV